METRQVNEYQSISQVSHQIFDPNSNPTTPIPKTETNSVYIDNWGKFVREGSTYHWVIKTPMQKKMPGYSRPRNQAEKPNKQEVLI